MNIPVEVVVAFVIASFALVGTLINANGVSALKGIIAELRDDIELRKKREKKFEARYLRSLNRIAYLMDGIRVLLNQVEQARMKPCWTPEEWDPEIEDDEEAAKPSARTNE